MFVQLASKVCGGYAGKRPLGDSSDRAASIREGGTKARHGRASRDPKIFAVQSTITHATICPWLSRQVLPVRVRVAWLAVRRGCRPGSAEAQRCECNHGIGSVHSPSDAFVSANKEPSSLRCGSESRCGVGQAGRRQRFQTMASATKASYWSGQPKKSIE